MGANSRKRKTRRAAGAREPGSLALHWLTCVVAAGILIIPLVISQSGENSFRLPKELALRFEVIIIVMILATVWGFGRFDLPLPKRNERWLPLLGLIVAWTIVCAIFSTNKLVSIPPTARLLEYALLFVVTVLVMRQRSTAFAAFIIPAAIVNAVVYVLQESEVWRPFQVSADIEKHLTNTGLVGNPNDVGSYFVAPALVATALALTNARGRKLWAISAILITAATFATQTVAAIGALTVALIVMLSLWQRSWRAFIAITLAGAILAAAAFAVYAPLRERATLMRNALAQGDYDTFSASRAIPFATAFAMARDHPMMGVGPGNFAYLFFDYKLQLQERHRWLFMAGGRDFNFGEAHNDHLQVAAETGLPGYALMLTAILLLASGSWMRSTGSEGGSVDGRRAYVRLLALPLALSFFVLALAQFPIELVAPTSAYLWAVATIVAWRPW